MLIDKLFCATVYLFTAMAISCSNSKTSTAQKDFISIFNGKDFQGWEGDTTYWKVKGGTMVGEITPQNLLKRNSFIIWRGGQPADFELKIDYRISASGNSGVNYRSVEIDSLPFSLKGYQCDIDGKDASRVGFPVHTGQNYEERGRQFLARRGQRVAVDVDKKVVVIDTLGEREILLKSIHFDDWNEIHLVVIGNNMKHYINGTLMSEVTDNDTSNRTMKGLIGVQVHVGPPMKVEFRNIRLKTYKEGS
jgi:3-keto-disaccharide hydrolase